MQILPVESFEEGKTFWALISDECRQMFEIINHVTLIGMVCVFGITTNLINIVVFCKQGLDNTINISLLGISVSDLVSLITLGWLVACVNPYAEHADLPYVAGEVQYLTGGCPHICFTRATCWITLYITAERCLCIAVPLKVKQIITPARTKIIVISIFVFMILSLVPEYATIYFDWKVTPPWNTSRVGMIFRNSRQNVVGFVFILHAVLGLTSFFTVILLTSALVVKLKRKATWRKKSTFDNDQSEAISSRDKKTMTMVVLIAGVLIVCFIPGVTLHTAGFFEPGLNLVGKYSNLFHIGWSFAFLFEAINSSVNIFLYYNMSTKYRQTLRALFFNEKSTG